MVSAVFHSPRDAARGAEPAGARPAAGRAAAPRRRRTRRAPRPPPAARPLRLAGLAGRVLPPVLGLALLVGIWGLLTQKGGSFPTPAPPSTPPSSCSPTRSTATAPTTRASAGTSCSRCSAWPGLRAGGAGGHSAGLHDRPLRLLNRMVAADQPAAAGVAAGLAADRPAGVQGGQPGGHLDHLHLLDLADGHQHRGGRAARAAGLPERGARAEPQRMESSRASCCRPCCPTC
jgi:hypothetical protein